MNEDIVVPSIEDLRNLREEGKEVGYRGIYIYLRYRAILSVLRESHFSKVLSIGCGYGIFDRLLPEAIEFTGIDIGKEQVEFASNWARAQRPTYRYLAGDFREMSLPAASFDMVIISEVLEHIPEEQLASVLAEIDRVLPPGGHILLTVPNRKTLRNRARTILGMAPVIMDKTHLREYELSEIQSLVESLPHRIVKFAPAVLYFPFEQYVRRLIPPHGLLRQKTITAWPGVCSHFIYLLQKQEH